MDLASFSPRARARQTTDERTLSPSAPTQVVASLMLVCVLLGLSLLSGALAARMLERNVPANPLRRSAMPLTSAALLAELKPPPDISGLAEALRSAAQSPAPAPPPPSPVATPAPAVQPVTMQAGMDAIATNLEPGGCLNLRDAPGTSGRVLQCIPAGETLRVVAGPQEADGYRWWEVDKGGWAAETYLAQRPAAVSAPAPSTAGAQTPVPAIAAGTGQSTTRRYIGWATYYGVEDGFRFGDVMYDGTPYNPADPTMTAASFLIPIHTWLLVCTAIRCIVVQVRDRGLLDENGILLDLSRAAYAELFAGLGGKQAVAAFVIDPAIVALLPPTGPPQPR